MVRVKRGTTVRRRHNKVLRQAKGFKGNRHRLYKQANEAVMHSMRYQYRDRRNLKRDMRRLWIIRINAAARQNGMPYGRFIEGLTKAGVEVDRKMLADLAVRDAAAFTSLVEVAKQHTTAPAQ